MSELGSGSGSSYPGALDTDNTLEVNSPNAGKTKARAEVPNDLAAAVVAIQTELGTDPAGTLTNVKTFLQTEHNTDGTHPTLSADTTGNADTATVATGISCDSEVVSTGDTLDCGTVTDGDRLFIHSSALLTSTSDTSIIDITITKSSGTATIEFTNGRAAMGTSTYLSNTILSTHSVYTNMAGIVKVTGSGTLVLAITLTNSGGGGATSALYNYAFFLKKN